MRNLQWICLLALGLACATSHAVDSAADIKAAKNKQLVRGGIVFKHYCVLCHGENGDGNARAAKLYDNLSLSIGKQKNAGKYAKIIRKGGKAVGRSPYMPPWEDELSKEQISDVINYVRYVRDAVKRGEVVYKTNCVLCHGVNADGKGRASGFYTPPPANLTKSTKSDNYKIQIVTKGGAKMGRSAVMPEWGLQLNKQEITDVVAYLRTIKK